MTPAVIGAGAPPEAAIVKRSAPPSTSAAKASDLPSGEYDGLDRKPALVETVVMAPLVTSAIPSDREDVSAPETKTSFVPSGDHAGLIAPPSSWTNGCRSLPSGWTR